MEIYRILDEFFEGCKDIFLKKTDIKGPDYNQNNPLGTDYIKNRPFYDTRKTDEMYCIFDIQMNSNGSFEHNPPESSNYYFNLPDWFTPVVGEIYYFTAGNNTIPFIWDFNGNSYMSISTMYNGSFSIVINTNPTYDYAYFIAGGFDGSYYGGKSMTWYVPKTSGTLKQIDTKYLPDGIGYDVPGSDFLGATLHIDSTGRIAESQNNDGNYYFNFPFFFKSSLDLVAVIGDDEFPFTISGSLSGGGGGSFSGNYGGGGLSWVSGGQQYAPNHERAYITYSSNPSVTSGKEFRLLVRPSYHKIDNKYIDIPVSTGRGLNSVILGDPDRNLADGNLSIAEGSETAAYGQGAHAEGDNTLAYGTGAHAEGYCSAATAGPSHSEGSSYAKGMYSHSEGYVSANSLLTSNITKVSSTEIDVKYDYSSYAGLFLSISDKIYDIRSAQYYSYNSSTRFTVYPEIPSTITTISQIKLFNKGAFGDYSHSEGYTTISSGESSHSEGRYTTASGSNSHAEGYSTRALGNSAHSEGYDTLAAGYYSHADGYYTTAVKRSQHVFGEYNISESGSYSEKGTYIEIVGNGTAENNRSNARTLDWAGNETISGNMTVNGGVLTLGTLKLRDNSGALEVSSDGGTTWSEVDFNVNS